MNIKAFARHEGRRMLSAWDQGCEDVQGGIAAAIPDILQGLGLRSKPVYWQ